MILAGIVALIVQAGSGLEAITASRIFPVTLPENIGADLGGGPAIVYRVIGGSSDATLETSGMQKLRVQFDCYAVGSSTASGYGVAVGVREALRLLLNGYQGALPDGSFLDNADLIESRDVFMNDARQYVAEIEFRLLFTFNDE